MRKAKLFMMLALLVMGVSNVFAQNVTVHPGNGSMLAAKKSTGGDTFFNWGGFATWKHEQLSLTMTTGDDDNNSGTDANGQVANPANDIFASADGKSLQIGKGNSMDTYLTICLPKGYRFTGYEIKFHRISSPNGATGSVDNYNGNISFGETNNAFGYTNVSGTYQGNISRNNSNQYTLTRTSNTVSDMGNVLYFKLSNGSTSGRCFIQLDHVELYFTAEHNYTPIIPAPNVSNQSAVDISFTTSKMDYGTLSSQSDGGAARISYNGTIHDLNANLTLYEDGSVKEVSDNGYDGTAGLMVDYKSGSISSSGDYFKLESTKHGKLSGDTAIYYIESPIWATKGTSANANKNPIGYRIIGAKFDYASGETYVPATFYIRYESTGHGESQDGIYGLNLYEGGIAYNYNYQTVWRIDQDGYIYNGEYYLQTGNSNSSTTLSVTTTKPSASRGTFEIVDNNGQMQIRRKSNTNYYIGWQESESWYYDDGWQTRINRTAVLTTNANNRAYYDEQSPSGLEGNLNYTFLIYDKTGTKVEKKQVVTGTSGSLSIDGLNNDAVKIGIIGTGLIKGSLTMQALDPYIDRLDIVCQEQGGNGGKLTQQFNSTDFSVRGGKFTFYVPEDFKAPALFTFENLYSHYGDETYYNETSSKNHARYFFVGSTYGDTDANVYNRSESADYTTKVACLQPGDKKYTFNNAATVTNSGGEFEEYPFSKALYASKVSGSFNDFLFTQEEMNGEAEKTAYLFTCDETRYNIAPTTATQHVYYAYYEMTIDMHKKTYQPIMAWEKLYDETFYSANTTDIKRDSKWGLKLTTEQVTDDQGTHSGYLTVTQILDHIKGRAASGTQGTDDYVEAIPSALTGNNAPSSMDQILYIDGSDLMSIVENQTATGTGYTSHPTSELKAELDKNALIYLPYGSKSSNDNFAYNTVAQYGETPSFRGASNIVIADRYPFYAPYDIQVDGAKMAVYERTITNPNYDPILHATIVLPFEINVDANGLHTNNDGQGTPFTLSTMNSSNALARAEGSKTDFYGEGYFTTITEKSAANTPYIVTLENAGEDGFIAHVNGSLVKATPKAANGVFTNETSTGTFEGTTYNFTHTGTYTGKEIANASTATETVFYFANNYFLDSKTLSTGKSLKILPFRSFYAYTTSGGSAGAKMTRFSIVFGENENDNNTTGISKVQRDADLAVIPGDGSITLMAKTDKNVTIHAVNGQTIDKCNLKAGDSRTVSLPAGVYVINGVKMIVK